MLHYQFYNNSNRPNSPILVFLGGFTASCESWCRLADTILENQDCTILLIDNLGAGKSPQPAGKYTTRQMAEMVIEVISQLNLNSINLVGHSMGGAIAQHIAIVAPQLINHLYLLSTATSFSQITKMLLINRYEFSRLNIDKKLIANMVIPTIFGNSFLVSPDNVELAVNRSISNPQNIDGLFGQLHACLTHDTTEVVSQISCKTTIITGDEDILVTPDNSIFLNKMIKNSTLHIIDDSAHMIQLEKPEVLAKLLLNLVHQ